MAGKLVSGLFLLLKLFIRQKQMFSTLILIYFGEPPLGHTIKLYNVSDS